MDQSRIGTIPSRQMQAILDVARTLAGTPDLDALLTLIARSAAELLNAERASIFLHDENRGELWTRVALGSSEIRVPETAGIVGHVFKNNALLATPEPYDDPRFNREIDRRSGYVTRNLLTAPARDMARQPIGVLQVVNRVGGAFNENDQIVMELLAEQVGVAIQRHLLHEQAVQAAGLRHEMNLAHKVQMAMIPQQSPAIAHARCVGWTQPASITGGDSYDLWSQRDGRLGIFLGDASGHGIAPAIVVTQVRTLVRALCDIEHDPTHLLGRVNARLAADLDSGIFCTTFFGWLASNGQLTWTSAGHGPIFARPRAEGRFEMLNPQAPPIGILPELESDPAAVTMLEPGGVFVVMSDGIFEARGPEREMFGVERVMGILEGAAHLPPEDILAAIRDAIGHWQGKDIPDDDQTVVIIQRLPSEAARR